MKKVYAVYFVNKYTETRIPTEGEQRVYAETPREAMIRAGAILFVQPDAHAYVREV